VTALNCQVGADENLLVKDHTHTFVNRGGEIGGMYFVTHIIHVNIWGIFVKISSIILNWMSIPKFCSSEQRERIYTL